MSPIETHVDFIYVFLHISLGIWFVLIIHCSWVIAGDAAHRLAHCPAQYEARATKCGQVSLPQTILCLPLRFHFCLNFFFVFFVVIVAKICYWANWSQKFDDHAARMQVTYSIRVGEGGGAIEGDGQSPPAWLSSLSDGWTFGLRNLVILVAGQLMLTSVQRSDVWRRVACSMKQSNRAMNFFIFDCLWLLKLYYMLSKQCDSDELRG